MLSDNDIGEIVDWQMRKCCHLHVRPMFEVINDVWCHFDGEECQHTLLGQPTSSFDPVFFDDETS